MQSPNAAAFISWSSQSYICVHFYKITWNLIFHVVEQLKVTALQTSLGSASLWMHPLGSRERSTPTLPVHLAISTKNQLCLVKDLAVTGYWALQGIIWEGTFHSHCSALQIPIKAICYNMNISPAFFSPKLCEIVGLTWRILLSQGVCHAFSKAYHHICMREHVLQVAVTALDWLYPRTPSIQAVTTYLVEPGTDKVLQRKSSGIIRGSKAALERKCHLQLPVFFQWFYH